MAGKKEIIGKFERIRELQSMGFNVPRTLLVTSINESEINEFISRVTQDFVNIRTYTRDGITEGWSSIHHVYVSKPDVISILQKDLSEKKICMIDLEDPRAGIYAGNLELSTGKKFYMEYVHKPDAMVRDVNNGAFLTCGGGITNLADIPDSLYDVVVQALDNFKKPYNSVILEFTVTKQPQGTKQENIVFWEYRDLR